MKRRAHSGFTLAELVLVIIVVGILSAVAVEKFGSATEASVPAAGEQMKSLVRFAQKLAIAQNREVYVTASSSYVAVCYDAACTTKVTAPAGKNSETSATLAACGSSTWLCEAAPASMSVAPSSPYVFYFDAEGRPYRSTDASNSDTSSFSTVTISLSGATPAVSISVEAETGYVH